MSRELEERLAALERQLQKERQTAKLLKGRRTNLLALTIVLLGIFVGWSIYSYMQHQGEHVNSRNTYLPYIKDELPFPVFKYKPSTNSDFQLVNHTVRYEDGVVFFVLRHQKTNESITITQQALPQLYAGKGVDGDQRVANPYGVATVSTRAGRTIGTLIDTSEHTLLLAIIPDSMTGQAKLNVSSVLPQFVLE